MIPPNETLKEKNICPAAATHTYNEEWTENVIFSIMKNWNFA